MSWNGSSFSMRRLESLWYSCSGKCKMKRGEGAHSWNQIFGWLLDAPNRTWLAKHTESSYRHVFYSTRKGCRTCYPITARRTIKDGVPLVISWTALFRCGLLYATVFTIDNTDSVDFIILETIVKNYFNRFQRPSESILQVKLYFASPNYTISKRACSLWR